MEGRKLVIDVIDNGGQWTHREWRMLRYLGVDTKIFPNDTPLSGLREVDGLILSGGAARVGLTGELGNCAEYLTLDVPILGICAGHQFMAGYYGGKSAEAPKPEFGENDITGGFRREDFQRNPEHSDSLGKPQRRGHPSTDGFLDHCKERVVRGPRDGELWRGQIRPSVPSRSKRL